MGIKLRELREDRGLSQIEIAKEFNVNQKTISNYETGKREPSFELVERFCKFFNVKAGYFLGFDDE